MSPSFWFQFVFKLAAATGWSENTIWKMPLARAWQYYHAALLADGVTTVATDDAQLEMIYERLLNNGKHHCATDAR